jgi:hypothetical protein
MTDIDKYARYRRIVSGLEKEPEPDVQQLRNFVRGYVEKLSADTPERSPQPSSEEIAADQERVQRRLLEENLRKMRAPVIVERNPDGSLTFKDDKQIRDGGRIYG